MFVCRFGEENAGANLSALLKRNANAAHVGYSEERRVRSGRRLAADVDVRPEAQSAAC